MVNRFPKTTPDPEWPPSAELVVLHKSTGQKFFRARAGCVPGIGQIVAALQADPQGLGSGMVFPTVNETSQTRDRANHFVESRTAFSREFDVQDRVHTLPFARLEDHFTIDVGTRSTQIAHVHQWLGLAASRHVRKTADRWVASIGRYQKYSCHAPRDYYRPSEVGKPGRWATRSFVIRLA